MPEGDWIRPSCRWTPRADALRNIRISICGSTRSSKCSRRMVCAPPGPTSIRFTTSSTGLRDMALTTCSIPSVAPTEKYDDIKVRATLNQIAGLDHTGKHKVGVPAIFGMNFQVVNTGQKKSPGGYKDSAGTPSAALAEAFHFVDVSLVKMVAALAARQLLDSTLIIVTAKHGNAPIDPLQYRRVSPSPSAILLKAHNYGFARELGIAVLWLKHQDQTKEILAKFDDPE